MMKHVAKAAKSSFIIGFFATPAFSFLSVTSPSFSQKPPTHIAASNTPIMTTTTSSWDDLVKQMDATPVGKALTNELEVRKTGKGSPHVHNTLRKFDSDEDPQVILYRDHAGWCPYCQKLMLLVEEKQVPVQISLVNMRSYGDKPTSFLQKVPGGLLPAMEVNGKIITESQVIMELLDQWFPPEEGYRPMMPSTEEGMARYKRLARLERDLFSWWCTLVFRPEGPALSGGSNPFAGLLGGATNNKKNGMSSSMQGFLDCLRIVDQELSSTKGPWFFDEHDYPTMIDFVFVSHVERMLASCAYWKGLNLRNPKWGLDGLNAWIDAFEKREHYLAFKSDYYTHVMDIPPQYGPGYDGGFEEDRKQFSRDILGRGPSGRLPLPHDDSLQPLYKGPPLPLCVLQSVGIEAGPDGSLESADPALMKRACRMMAAWKLAGNGGKVTVFAARGGPKGAKNPRKTFGAPLADPYAASDDSIVPYVDAALRVVCQVLAAVDEEMPASHWKDLLQKAIPTQQTEGVVSSLAYLRDRVGVPRDLPLASARYLRAYLNWAIDELSSN
ncbi:glutathione S-transferase [Fistulifera solaris]|uniref:Glutathione S-transferase n=1 Tax=Fistulifera solaris TaxID=1519565 RepID=A0A1Z5JVL0_FISSO|nr:glutathione S-transferase [Fistulifera solaris]|eukprot:GAX18073.1 glutathione S-transferase [Fistulifera solaris]